MGLRFSDFFLHFAFYILNLIALNCRIRGAFSQLKFNENCIKINLWKKSFYDHENKNKILFLYVDGWQFQFDADRKHWRSSFNMFLWLSTTNWNNCLTSCICNMTEYNSFFCSLVNYHVGGHGTLCPKIYDMRQKG